MLIVELFTWWYSRGFIELFLHLLNLLRSIWQKFSVPLLLKTLFAPWKRITTEPGKSLQEHTRAWLDNLISRLVGFTIRIFVILAALISILFISIGGMVLILVWPFMPPAVIYFLVRMII